MRIGMLADLYRPHISGVTIHIDVTRRALEARGHDVYVFTFGDPQPDDDPRVIRSPGLNLRVRQQGLSVNMRYARPARMLVTTMDVLHAHHPFISGQLALRYGRPWGIPVVFTNHTRYDLYMRAYLPLLPPTLGDALLRTYLPRFCREVDAVIAPSPGVRAMLERLGVDVDVHIIPNGVDLTPFRKEVKPVPREAWGWSRENVVVTYLGRLGPEKNLGFLLRAFAAVSAVYPQARLLFIGKGPERETLQETARQMGLGTRVAFTGLVPHEDVPKYLAAADVFATASLTEVHPLSVIEAQAAGLPVAAVRAPGVEDVVVHGETGFLVENDVAALAAALGRLIGEEDLRRRMAAQARKRAQRFDVRNTARDLEALYQGLQERRQHFHPSWKQRFQRWWQRQLTG